MNATFWPSNLGVEDLIVQYVHHPGVGREVGVLQYCRDHGCRGGGDGEHRGSFRSLRILASSTPGRRAETRTDSADPSALAWAGATVIGAGGVVAREVLAADAANLLPNNFRAGDGRRSDGHLRCQCAPGGDEVKSARERAEEKREEKLELMREQVQNGSLVIRKMTKEERRRYPRRPDSRERADRR